MLKTESVIDKNSRKYDTISLLVNKITICRTFKSAIQLTQNTLNGPHFNIILCLSNVHEFSTYYNSTVIKHHNATTVLQQHMKSVLVQQLLLNNGQHSEQSLQQSTQQEFTKIIIFI